MDTPLDRAYRMIEESMANTEKLLTMCSKWETAIGFLRNKTLEILRSDDYTSSDKIKMLTAIFENINIQENEQ